MREEKKNLSAALLTAQSELTQTRQDLESANAQIAELQGKGEEGDAVIKDKMLKVAQLCKKYVDLIPSVVPTSNLFISGKREKSPLSRAKRRR